jgi:hypothetical protein
MRLLPTLLLGAALMACSPAPQKAPEAAPTPPVAAAPEESVVLAALTARLKEQLGAPLKLDPETVAVDGDWAWIVAAPRSTEGGPLDFSKTKLAGALEQGVMDANGNAYGLLRREGGTWTVKEAVVGPTDVAWLDWPQKHGVPPALLGIEAAP